MDTFTISPDTVSYGFVNKVGYKNNYDMSTHEDVLTENSSISKEYPLFKHPVHMIVLYSVAYSTVFVFGVLGNSFVIAVIYKNRTLRNLINYFILNMAIADVLIALFCVPITLLANIYTGWRFGAFLCKITPYAVSVVQCASVNTLAAIACDRYRAICYTRHSKISSCTSRATIASIWAFASTIMIPLLIFYETYQDNSYKDMPMCHQLWPSYDLQRGYFLVALFFLCYALPLLMIFVCYVLIAVTICRRNAPGVQKNGRLLIYKSKVKVLKMLAVIVILFAFSWLPLYVVYLRLYFGDVCDEELYIIFEIIVPLAQWLGSANCGMNPIIYCLFSKKYSRELKKIIYCRLVRFAIRRHCRKAQSMSTRCINVENLSCKNADMKLTPVTGNRVSNYKYMVVIFHNGAMTVSFRKENASEDSSF